MVRFMFRLGLCSFVLMTGLLTTGAVLARLGASTSVASSQTRAIAAPQPTVQIIFGPPGPAVSADNKGTATASCPAGWLLRSGGFRVPDYNKGTGTITDVNESSASASTANGLTTWSWTVVYRNTGGAAISAQAQIVCQKPVPSQELHVLTIVGPRVTSGPGANSAHAAATCPSGTLLTGGGYEFQTGGETAHITENRSIDGNAWQVEAFTPNATISFDAYAYCTSIH